MRRDRHHGWLVAIMLFKIIDRYIARFFLQSFLVCYLSLACVFIVFDFFTNVDEFTRAAEGAGGLMRLFTLFYGPQSLAFLDRLLGFLILTAAMFTAAWLQRQQEMTALLAAGISRARATAPVVAGSLVLIFCGVLNREVALPRMIHLLARSNTDLLGEKPRPIQARYDNTTDVLLRGQAAYRKDQRIQEPNFVLPPNLDDYGPQLMAENAYYLPANSEHPAGYLLDTMIRPKDLKEKPSLSLNGQPVLLTPRDHPWLEDDQCFLVSSIDFEQLTGGRVWREYSSTWSLIKGLRNPGLDLGADVRVRIHSRIVQPLRDLNLLFLGLPLVVRREQRNVFVALGLGVFVVSLFTAVVLISEYLGNIYLLSPAFAAWLPFFFSVPAAVAQLDWLWE